MRRANAWAASPMGRASTSASNEGEGAARRRHHLQCVSAHLTSKKSIEVALWSHDVTTPVLLRLLDRDTKSRRRCQGGTEEIISPEGERERESPSGPSALGRGYQIWKTRAVHGSRFREPFDPEWLEGLGWWPDVGRVLAGWWGVSQPELTLLSLSLLISPLVEATKFGNPSGSRFTVQGAF